MAGDVVDGGSIVSLEGINVADIIGSGGVGGVTELVEGVVLLVEEEWFDGGVFDEAELVVAHPLGYAVFGVRVRRALDGGPELVVGRVEAHGVPGRVDGLGEGFGVGEGRFNKTPLLIDPSATSTTIPPPSRFVGPEKNKDSNYSANSAVFFVGQANSATET
ncbi:hypothetical protein SESBI_26046 [Sesbania bispinosa]|nr:hypothetical protein SESBI_26046 [Sesbania bispinosa]